MTAQRRGERAQRVPVAIVALSGEALDTLDVKNMNDLPRVAPSLLLARGSGMAKPFLRGVGSTINTLGAESSIEAYVDEIYYTRVPVDVFTLNNVERLEVLKGPQVTLFGRNASGGVIHIITKDPSQTPMVKGSVGIGDYQTLNGASMEPPPCPRKSRSMSPYPAPTKKRDMDGMWWMGAEQASMTNSALDRSS